MKKFRVTDTINKVVNARIFDFPHYVCAVYEWCYHTNDGKSMQFQLWACDFIIMSKNERV